MTGTLYCPFGSHVITSSGSGKSTFFGGGNSAGNGLFCPASGLLNGPGGSVKVSCGLNGVTSTNRLLKIPACRESKNTPPPARRLVLPSPVRSYATPTRGAKFLYAGRVPYSGTPGSP